VETQHPTLVARQGEDGMKRRTALKLVAAGVAAERVQIAGRQLFALAQAPSGYKLRFFSDDQNALLDRLTELIIPADDHSPGARAAKVSLFIDLMVSHSEPDVQDQWTHGLRAVENESRERFQKPFLECDAARQDQVMQTMSANEDYPETELDKFFGILKSRTIDGYYTS
jgi:hypothetical protein